MNRLSSESEHSSVRKPFGKFLSSHRSHESQEFTWLS